jgi:hypothetical protein
MRPSKKSGAINFVSMPAAILIEHDLCPDVLSLAQRYMEEDTFM